MTELDRPRAVHFVLFSRTLGARLAWLVMAGVLVCPVFLDSALSLMSDGPGFLLATLALLAIALGLGVTFGTAQMRDRFAGSRGGWWPELQRSLERVAAEAGPEARILTRPATARFYFQGLRGAKPLARLTGDPKADLALIERTQADYVILTPRLLYDTEERVLGVIDAFPKRFHEVEAGRLARAYRVLPAPQSPQTAQPSSTPQARR
jgi:hypothetical protein